MDELYNRCISLVTMITIDGSFGEGGGQILRSSLGLSLVTGKAFGITRIRSGRRKPGLLRQHLTALKAAGEISRAHVQGDTLGSQAFTFTPQKTYPGAYHFAVGTAGSATLVLQTILPALLIADGESKITVEGGTHNSFAPPFDFLEKSFLQLINRMGPEVTATIQRYGFYPAGGGKFSVTIRPAKTLSQFQLLERGKIQRRKVTGIVSKIPLKIARDEVNMILQKLSWNKNDGFALEVESPGPGNAVMIEVASEHVTEVFIGFGERKKPRKKVASEAIAQYKHYINADVPVGKNLADQLLIPMAMAGGGAFRTCEPSLHTKTNIEVITQFLDVDIQCVQLEDSIWEITVKSAKT